MATVSLKHINKTYPNGFEAVKDFNLEIEDGEFVIFVGPSGCGKSTTLRMIAGLEDISAGDLLIDGKRMNDEAPKDRDLAMVFQSYALYPHMTVKQNMEFPLKIAKLSKEEMEKRVEAASSILGLEPLLERKPKALSGGQRQRVAMGRAIVREPKVLLMDEPLSNLDAKLRGQMRVEISRLHEKLGSTIVYVTHDQTEAMTLGDRIVVMCDGVVQQIDTPQNLYDNPANKFVAGFIGAPQMNFMSGTLKNGTFQIGNKEIELSNATMALLKKAGYGEGAALTLGIRPEDLTIRKAEDGVGGLDGVVEVYEMLGSSSNVYVDVEGLSLVASVASDTVVQPQDSVVVGLNADKMHWFDESTGVNVKMK
ncbi:ABC transporter ATP-binding protein [uncultured Dubosiella sp.]|uniref:ABC transporter ATP-binding protein n=2 Tax=uncultured Dubosiella sp. TaxID=1937011 RepID=UPI002598F0D2|nr:sn-glycerol-3-phosphate ABC transporter ATP-binding protein UgpC [uncultured Dubosiella sp.]